MSIEITLPAVLPEERRTALLADERDLATTYLRDGRIVRIWRIPGTTNNVGIWKAAGADELHELLAALPLFPWMEASVTPLATHPVEIDTRVPTR